MIPKFTIQLFALVQLVSNTVLINYLPPEVHSGPRQMFKMKLTKIVVFSLNLLIIFEKSSMLDIWEDHGFAFGAIRPKHS